MGKRILWAIIIGVLGVVLMPHLKEPVDFILSTGEPYSAFVQLFIDNIYIVMLVAWVGVILLLLFWGRKSSDNESQQG